jgi:hypothetical protein
MGDSPDTDAGRPAADPTAGDVAAGAEGHVRKQSLAGIISCGLFALFAVLLFVFRVIRPGEDVSGPAEGTVRLMQLIGARVSFYALLLGVMFAFFGVVQRDRRRRLAALGLVLNGLPFLMILLQVLRRSAG